MTAWGGLLEVWLDAGVSEVFGFVYNGPEVRALP